MQEELIKILKKILEIKKKYKASVELLNGEIITNYGEIPNEAVKEALQNINYEDVKQIKLIRR